MDYSYDKSGKSNDASYTYIEISELNEVWSIEEVNKAKESLRRLKNPFLKDDGFKILVVNNIDLANTEEHIESNIAEVLKDKSITVEARFDENIEVSLFDRGEKIIKLKKKSDSILKNCPISISINFLTFSAKLNFTRKMKVEPVNFGNLFIYKNNFRVVPYGEMDFDTFGLNMRKAQGYNRYLGHREILGHISIKDFSNSYFKETSSRDSGFVSNIYFDELKELYLFYVHRVLEAYVQLISWGELKSDDKENIQEVQFEDANDLEISKFKNYISKRGEIIFFKENVKFDENKPEKKLEKLVKTVFDGEKKDIAPIVQQVKKQFSELKKASEQSEKIVREKNKDIQLLEHQNYNLVSRNRTSESYKEQITHHFTDLSERIYYDSLDLLEIYKEVEDQQLKERLISIIRNLKGYVTEIDDFKKILIETNYNVDSAINNLNWIEISRWFFERKLQKNRDCKVIINSDDNHKKWSRSTRILDLTMAYENFYKNAKEHGAKFLNIEFTKDKILLSSDSKPINEELLVKIFEDGFSTKINGSGIGLNQVSNFLESQELSIKVNNVNGLVVFEIE